jgi:hypothetical protein
VQVNYEFCSVSHLASGNEIKVLGHPKMEEQILVRFSRKSGRGFLEMESSSRMRMWLFIKCGI